MNIDQMKKQEFLDTYIKKEELQAFCKRVGLQSNGSKLELKEIIAHYLETGEKISLKKKQPKANDEDITLDSIITLPISCSEKKRAFFIQHLGKGFRFYVPFQKWLKANEGKTYRDAVAIYPQLIKEKKEKKTTIDQQFEYNTYIRDFFADNQGKSLQDAILCWKEKKQKQGSHAYEREDLKVLCK